MKTDRDNILDKGFGMKKRAEIAVAALAVMFICFTIGYFAGRRSIPSQVSISTDTLVITPAIIEAGKTETETFAAESLPPISEPDYAPATEAPAAPEISAVPVDAPTPEVTAAATEVPAPPEPTPEPAPAGESHYTEDGLLRINLATQKELETLPGIGEVIAARIIEYRTQNGSFARLSTLKVIKGIGDSRYNSIKDLITVE